jgi:ubiquinone/menaquinone biosynthesis C-methylase UbiE
MEAKLQRRIQRYGWDKASAYYERYWSAQLEPAQRLLLQFADIRPQQCVLDVACGTGLVTFPAAESVGSGGHITATDLSEKMIAFVGEEAAKRNVSNITAKWMDAEDLQLEDCSFDVAVCALGLMYVPDPVKALKEMHRVLKKNGRAVAAVWGARQACGWAEIFPIVDARVQSEVCPMFFQLGTKDSLKYAFQSAGFESVKAERIQTFLHYDTPEDACGAAFAGGPVALAYSKFSAQTREEAHLEYLASIERHKDESGYHIPGEFVVTTGIRSN